MAAPQFNALLLSALDWIESRPWKDSAQSLARFGAGSLERLHRKALKRGGTHSVESRHELRIRLKRLRYACELHRLQDLLGGLNDIAVARALCRDLDAAMPRQFGLRERRLIAALAGAWAKFEEQPRYWRPRG